MEKRDLVIVIAALAIVIVMALVVKPALTGEPPDLSIPVPGAGPEPTPEPTLPDWAKDYYAPTAVPATATPTPQPTWSGQPQTLGIVGPAVTPEATLSHSRLPEETTPAPEKLLTYATIDGNYGGMTENISMPFPYWELHYTVEPWDNRFVSTTESKAAGIASSFGAEVFPSFSIEVHDADNPDEIIRTIEPAGGLDPDLWARGENYDPRPWVEKFYEGTTRGDYYFVINTHMIRSYHIEILVPERYLGNY